MHAITILIIIIMFPNQYLKERDHLDARGVDGYK